MKPAAAVSTYLLLTLLITLIPALALNGAVDMFIKIGDIKGESLDQNHRDEIDVLAWSWGMSNDGTTHAGGGGGAGKVSMQDLSMTKYLDKSTPKILEACATGSHVPEAVLTVRKAGADPIEYLMIRMENVLVTSVSTGGSGGEDRLTENVTLNFSKVHVTYVPQDPTGGPEPPVEMSWDIVANTP
jgi:type VI secretion system secreted protein Hcp